MEPLTVVERRAGTGFEPARVGLAFATGVFAFHLLPGLPPVWLIGLPASVAALLALRLRRTRVAPVAVLLLFALLGALWAQIRACEVLCEPFPDTLARAPLVIEGRIASIPSDTGFARRFLFEVERTDGENGLVPFTGLVRISWYDRPPPLIAGERWRLPVRLKPRHGFANPGGFDYERWLFELGVKAAGNVRRGAERLEPGPGPFWLTRWRQRLGEHLAGVLGDAPALGLVQALVIGERSGLGPDDWELLTRTGTNHLVAISGLHVGLVATAVFFLVRRLWSHSPSLAQRLAAPRAAAIGAALAALAYSALAGFAISTQRALIMLAVVLGAVLWQRTPRPSHALIAALVGVLILDPQAVLSAGFWLSFGAVAVLLFNMGRRLPARGLWTRWGRAQWAVAIGLLPLLLLLFGRASLIAPLVNLVAVPLFSLLVLPLVLVASLVSLIPGLSMPLVVTAHLLGWGLDGLGWLSGLSWASASMAARPFWVFAAGVVGALLLLAPRGLPGRWLGLVLLLPLLVVRPAGPGYGEVWLTLLDVGQGLSAIVQTRDRTLVFDTGPGYESGFNTGSAVVAPFLADRGVGRVDLLVLSHADRDHAGGVAGLTSALEVARVISGEPEAVAAEGAEPCRAGARWDWSGVSFNILHPDGPGHSGNDASCVLQVRAGDQAILLTGDIGVGVEQTLVERIGEGLRSQVLVAAHHGSATSTGAAFLDAVDPDLVLFSSGYANHFGFPAPKVLERVTDRGAAMLNTGTEGAIELRIGADGTLAGPWSWRSKAPRLWTHRPE